MSDNDNVIIVKAWSSRLRGKESAIKFRQKCIQSLRLDETLRINMADVKEVSEGFAFECFGKLNRFANDHGAKVKFECAKEELKPILLKGIKDAKNL